MYYLSSNSTACLRGAFNFALLALKLHCCYCATVTWLASQCTIAPCFFALLVYNSFDTLESTTCLAVHCFLHYTIYLSVALRASEMHSLQHCLPVQLKFQILLCLPCTICKFLFHMDFCLGFFFCILFKCFTSYMHVYNF